MKFAHLLLLVNFVSIAAIAAPAKAASVQRVDVVKQLKLTQGDYEVTDVDFIAKGENLCNEGQQFKWSPEEDQNLCDKGAIHSVKLTDHEGRAILRIGQARHYTDFNAGLITNPPISKNQCVISHSTQSQAGKVIDDSYLNCTNENSSTHAEVEIKGDKLHYTQVTKITRAGKLVCIPLKCTLVRKTATAK